MTDSEPQPEIRACEGPVTMVGMVGMEFRSSSVKVFVTSPLAVSTIMCAKTLAKPGLNTDLAYYDDDCTYLLRHTTAARLSERLLPRLLPQLPCILLFLISILLL